MRAIVTSAAITLAFGSAGVAQEAGNIVEGRILAEAACADCHAVAPGDGQLENPPPLPWEDTVGPLAFEDVANTPGVTGLALNAWLVSTHPSMPDLILDGGRRADLIAYILSLKTDR